MSWINEFQLGGKHCHLQSLSMEHLSSLQESVVDGDIGKLRYAAVPNPESMIDNIKHKLKLKSSGHRPVILLNVPFRLQDYPDLKRFGLRQA